MTPSVPNEDEGLAAERTDLAWARTGASMTVILGTLLRGALTFGQGLAIAGLALGLAGAGVWAIGLRRARLLADTTVMLRGTAQLRTLQTIAFGTVVVASGALLLSVQGGR